MLVKGYEGMKAAEQGLHYPGPAVVRRRAETLEWLVRVCDALGKSAEASQWHRESKAAGPSKP